MWFSSRLSFISYSWIDAMLHRGWIAVQSELLFWHLFDRCLVTGQTKDMQQGVETEQDTQQRYCCIALLHTIRITIADKSKLHFYCAKTIKMDHFMIRVQRKVGNPWCTLFSTLSFLLCIWSGHWLKLAICTTLVWVCMRVCFRVYYFF